MPCFLCFKCSYLKIRAVVATRECWLFSCVDSPTLIGARCHRLEILLIHLTTRSAYNAYTPPLVVQSQITTVCKVLITLNSY